MQQVTQHTATFHEYVQTLSAINMDQEFDFKGRMGNAIKFLQNNLQQLMRDAQRLPAGDFNQQVHFMQDLAAAFDMMVENLRRTHTTLERHADELAEGRRAALNLMLDAQTARQETEEAYAELQAKVEQIEILQAKLRDEAIRDPITGCFNRRYMEETLRREFSRAQREAYPLCLMMVDIDHFKVVNDTYGHPAGDAVLQALGFMLRGKTRAGDIVCRYGGDEFLLVLPNMRLQDAVRRADAWRESFEETEVYYGEQLVMATLSMGIASVPEHGTESEQAILAADQALYRAKNSGRNRVVSA
jgi:diguanylate cyclase (GGDEF)-like protein